MRDFLIGCLGTKEKDLYQTNWLKSVQKAFWCLQWLDHATTIGGGVGRPLDQARGTVRNTGDLAAHGADVELDAVLAMLELGNDQKCVLEAFRLIYGQTAQFC
ncbi:hypothetical protein TWF481_010294 [Arthrobotrys musiformis]|uniref:Uncharacterized protein n=1 Tax=Arthrobotrys musiformis TaxID=47236 RepID=A0AAV9W0B9_9PEZI